MMEGKLQRQVFILVSDIAEEAFRNGSTVSADELMDRLDAKGLFFPGNREASARQLVSAALGDAVALDDGKLCEALSSSFVDSGAWPLLMRMEGGKA